MRSLIALAACGVLILAGCSPVLLDEPIGKQIEIDDNELKQIVGRWQVGDSTFEVKHLDGSRFEVTQIDDDPENEEEDTKTVIVTRTDKEHTYFHVEHTDDDADKTKYLLLRLGASASRVSERPENVVLYMANAQSFGKAVDAGKLTGKVKRNDAGKVTNVKVTSSAADVEKWLAAQENEPFLLDRVFVARKVK